jgi:hypothetical protein
MFYPNMSPKLQQATLSPINQCISQQMFSPQETGTVYRKVGPIAKVFQKETETVTI